MQHAVWCVHSMPRTSSWQSNDALGMCSIIASSHDVQQATAALGAQSQAAYWEPKLTLRMFSGLNAGLVIFRKYLHSW
jgi:hypothetical protein